MSGKIHIDTDQSGIRTLYVNGGEWDSACEKFFSDRDWNGLAMLGVEWPSYECLAPYADRIERIRVPFGPDDSNGFELLSRLKVIESTDALNPPVDFRKFNHLDYLEAVWEKKKPEYFANQNIETLLLHQVSGSDLSWVPTENSLRRIELRAGRLASLRGIEHAKGLQALVTDELKNCVDVTSIFELALLRSLRLDTPKALIEDIRWIAKMPDLCEAEFYGKVALVDWEVIAIHPKLKKFGVNLQQDNAGPDEVIKKALTASGKILKTFERYKGKNAGFYIEFS